MRNQKEKNENFVYFKGAKLNKHEANQAGFALIAGILGMVLAILFFGQDNKLYSMIMVGLFAGLGFLGYGFVKKTLTQKRP